MTAQAGFAAVATAYPEDKLVRKVSTLIMVSLRGATVMSFY